MMKRLMVILSLAALFGPATAFAIEVSDASTLGVGATKCEKASMKVLQADRREISEKSSDGQKSGKI